MAKRSRNFSKRTMPKGRNTPPLHGAPADQVLVSKPFSHVDDQILQASNTSNGAIGPQEGPKLVTPQQKAEN